MTHVLISGAGPVGMSAAITCLQGGAKVTVIDRETGPTDQSRAVGISAPTMKIFEKFGVAERISSEAEIMRGVAFHKDGKPLTKIHLPFQKSRLPLVRCLAQSRTERILLDALEALGGRVEWSHEMQSLSIGDNGVSATVKDRIGGGERDIQADFMLGADGSRSATRNALGIAFEGETLDDEWSIADITCAWPYAPLNACINVSADGHLIFIVTIGNGRFRAIANYPDVLDGVRALFPVSEVHTQGRFAMNIRVAERFGLGPVALAGDAAHVHTPVGGQGMNFGIADAHAFGLAVTNAGELEAYRHNRRRADKTMVWATTSAYRFAVGESFLGKTGRNALIKTIGFITSHMFGLAPEQKTTYSGL